MAARSRAPRFRLDRILGFGSCVVDPLRVASDSRQIKSDVAALSRRMASRARHACYRSLILRCRYSLALQSRNSAAAPGRKKNCLVKCALHPFDTVGAKRPARVSIPGWSALKADVLTNSATATTGRLRPVFLTGNAVSVGPKAAGCKATDGDRPIRDNGSPVARGDGRHVVSD